MVVILKPAGYWLLFEKIKENLFVICKQIKHFPVQKELLLLKRRDLINAIYRYHGGLLKVKKLLSTYSSFDQYLNHIPKT